MNNNTTITPEVDIYEMIGYDMLFNSLKRNPGIPLAQLRYVDILKPSLGCYGIYAFFGGDEYQVFDSDSGKLIDCWYIGSATGMAMVERIGGHFATRHNYFGNSLLKHIADAVACPADKPLFHMKTPSPQQEQRMEDIMDKCLPILKSLHLKTLLYEEAEDTDIRYGILMDEKVLIKHFQPAFNSRQRSRQSCEIRDGKGNKITYSSHTQASKPPL